jgi:hypothetical protein
MGQLQAFGSELYNAHFRVLSHRKPLERRFGNELRGNSRAFAALPKGDHYGYVILSPSTLANGVNLCG